jgi:hypothetical protein
LLCSECGTAVVDFEPLQQIGGIRKSAMRVGHLIHPTVRWNEALCAVEFGVEIGEYAGVVRAPRRVFQGLLAARPTPEKCVEGYYLHRTRLERIAQRKLRHRQLTDDGNVEITGLDLRGRETGR